MKKYYKLIVSAMLAFVMLFSTAACKKNKGSSDSDETVEPSEKVGTHYADIKESEHYFVKNRSTEYTLVYPANYTSDIVRMAIDEFTYFFNMATGKDIDVKSDAETDWSDGAKFISLGDTDELSSSGVGSAIDKKELLQTGYAIKSCGQSVFIVGGDVYGTLNGTYRFLKEQFHFETYAADEIVIDTGVVNNKLLSYDVKDVPDIPFRLDASGEIGANVTYARRLGYSMQSDLWIPVGQSYIHNFLTAVPPEWFNDPAQPENYHPDWFSTNGQLCLTRDLEGLSDYVSDRMLQKLKEYPDAYVLTFSLEDNGLWCECESCSAMRAEYGTDSASYIRFLNTCSDKLKTKVAADASLQGREYYLRLDAYHKTTDAPARRDSDGNFYPCKADGTRDDSMFLRDDIFVQYCPIYAAGYHSYDKEQNKTYDEIMNAWSTLASRICVWSYSYYYLNKGTPYFDFYDMSDTYNYVYQHNAMAIFDEDYPAWAIGTDWMRLKTYLRAKIGWDVNCDLNAYTDAFFKNYYKAAADTMRELFDSYSVYYTMLIEDNNLRGQCGACEVLELEWDKGLVDGWMRLFDKAYADIEYLKTSDSDLYKKLEERICLDSLSLRYLSQQVIGSCAYVGNGNTLTEDAQRFGISM